MPKVLSPQDIEAFRERLCDIAEEKFAAQGINGVTLRDLATAMGVSPMTPYRYFKDKDAILAAVRSRAFNRFAETMEKSEGAMRKKGG
ncbi:MAG: TetR/AcrR family transcriptional regulator, partial [Burkholderiales bacterium]